MVEMKSLTIMGVLFTQGKNNYSSEIVGSVSVALLSSPASCPSTTQNKLENDAIGGCFFELRSCFVSLRHTRSSVLGADLLQNRIHSLLQILSCVTSLLVATALHSR